MRNVDKLIHLCKLKQDELKDWLYNHLKNYYKDIDNSDGYLYCKGDIPVCLVAHMDTVHTKSVADVWISYDSPDIITSPQGIGGDDRCGVFALLQLKYLKPHLLFTEDEEIGAIGAEKFVKKYKELDVNVFIEIDRRGSNDVVRYDDDNDSVVKIFEEYGFKEEYGSFTDISTLCPHFGISGVNISSGYYNAHTTNEYINLEELLFNIKRIKNIIKHSNLLKTKHKYEESSYVGYYQGGYSRGYSRYSSGYNYYNDYYDYMYPYRKGTTKYTTTKVSRNNPKLAHQCTWCGEEESQFNKVYHSDDFDNICEDCMLKYSLSVCDECGEIFDTYNSKYATLCNYCSEDYERQAYLEYNKEKDNIKF